MVTDTANQVIDTLNRGAQAIRVEAGELGADALAAHDPDVRRREELRAGDRIAFVDNVGKGAEQVRNGARGTLTAVDLQARTATVELDAGRTVTIKVPESGRQPLRLAYAGHTMRVQGAEADVALVLPGAAHASRQGAYPMLSRGRGEVHVFVDREHHGADGRDPLEALAERWSISTVKRTATTHRDLHERLAADRDTGGQERACASQVWEAPEPSWGGRQEPEREWSHEE
jgi:hypothetical protein